MSVIWGVDFFARRRDDELARLREAMNGAQELKLERDSFDWNEEARRGLVSWAARRKPWASQECPYLAPESDGA